MGLENTTVFLEKSVSAQGAETAVLFVDDEPRSVKYFVRAFGKDFPILTATSVAEAESVLEREQVRVGVLVSDQRMPVETGVQLLNRVKKRYPHIVRVLTTAYADLDDAIDAVNSGEIHRYILKPWDIESLRTELRVAMDLHRRRRHESDIVQAKRGTMMTLAAHVAHEVSTPLATIQMLGASLEEHLPILIAAYRREQARGSEETIPHDVLETIAMAPGTIRNVAERASMLMQLLLVNTGEKSADENDYKQFSMRQCVHEALASYSFVDREQELVRLSGDDFTLWGSDVLMTFVLYNLLKNALYAIRTARKGEITIQTLPGSPNNRLLFRDTGKGIPPELLPRVFEEFFTARGATGATGMGLPFCRRVVEAFGGQIECRSEEGKYTELELSFPHPQQASRGREEDRR